METFADEPYAIHRAVIQRFGFSTTSSRSDAPIRWDQIGRHRSASAGENWSAPKAKVYATGRWQQR